MGECFLVQRGGSGGESGCTLTVTAPAGVTVTISKDGKKKTRTANNIGVAIFTGLKTGKWLVHITDGEQTAESTVSVNGEYSINVSFNTIPEFTYTGDYKIVNDQDEEITETQGDWKIRLLTSGTLRFTTLNGAANGIDVFCVGGGGAGGSAGGAGGYTATEKNVSLEKEKDYEIVVGAGGASKSAGGQTSAFSVTANGGGGPRSSGTSADDAGGNGGSGGGGFGGGSAGGNGGSDGSNGGAGNYGAGSGQGSTTREFGEDTGTLYAGGGAGAGSSSGIGGAGGGGGGQNNQNWGGESAGVTNTGGGGGGGFDHNGSDGGSGIVIIRNKRG